MLGFGCFGLCRNPESKGPKQYNLFAINILFQGTLVCLGYWHISLILQTTVTNGYSSMHKFFYDFKNVNQQKKSTISRIRLNELFLWHVQILIAIQSATALCKTFSSFLSCTKKGKIDHDGLFIKYLDRYLQHCRQHYLN